MFNRRFIREKIIQHLYAFYQADETDCARCEKNMVLAFGQLYNLYVLNFALLVKLGENIQNRLEEGKKKHLPTAEDLSPNTKFVNNLVLKKIKECSNFTLRSASLSIKWDKEAEMLRSIADDIVQSNMYKEYLLLPQSYQGDCTFLAKVLQKKVIQNSLYIDMCEEQSIFWAGDYEIIGFWASRKISSSCEEEDFNFPLSLFPEENNSDEEEDDTAILPFAKELLRKTIIHKDEYEQIITERLENWEQDRVALIEKLILRAAVTELIHFPSIPIKVSINEYIETAKRLGSEKSYLFVNGLLSRISMDLQREQVIKKSGRGLI